jgi:hypothetical protein
VDNENKTPAIFSLRLATSLKELATMMHFIAAWVAEPLMRGGVAWRARVCAIPRTRSAL